MKPKSFIGHRFGRLVVIDEYKKDKSIVCKCQCDCGNVKEILKYSLSSGNTTSCGCSRRYNLIGRRFGRLTVVSEAPRGEKYPHQKWYHCVCDCGNSIDLYTYALTSGTYRSCGCLQRESRFTDITGEVRGYLTAIRPTGEVRNGSAVWEWRCVCGNIIQATEQNVRPTGRKSCGCKRKTLNIEQAKHMHEVEKKYYVDGTNILSISSGTLFKNNTSGIRGVTWHNRLKRWQARITFKGKTIHLGYFRTLEDAAIARQLAEEKYFSPIVQKWESSAEDIGQIKRKDKKISPPYMKYIRQDKDKYVVSVISDSHTYYVGRFSSLSDAIIARDAKCAELGLPPIPHE